MGGHGGLNILHQKKWNVYNLDNRIKVQKDRKAAREKKKQQEITARNERTTQRLDLIRGQTKQEQPEQKNSLITQELRKMNEEKRHINLFEAEQRIIENKELLDAKIFAEKEHLKNKDIEVASKFLGTFSDERCKPWYMKKKDEKVSEKETSTVYKLGHIKGTHSEVTKDVLNIESQRKSRSRSRQKQTKNAKPMSKMDQLRLERQMRQEKERKRAAELLRSRGL